MRDSVLMLSNKNLEAITAAGFVWFDMFKPETELASIFAEKHNHESKRVELLIQNLHAQLQELKSDFEKRDSTPGNIHREINELQKGIARLTKLVADETLRLQKDNQALSKILKIKAKFFDKKQERDEFLIQYPEALNIRFHKSDACFPELVLKAV
jgi:septal ring factor EnvC (AmiA/AmiB activator)